MSDTGRSRRRRPTPHRAAALAEPTEPVRRAGSACSSLANLGVWMGFFTPIQVLLPKQIERIAPGAQGDDARLGHRARRARRRDRQPARRRAVRPHHAAGSAGGTRGPWSAACSGPAAWCCWPTSTPSLGVALGWVGAQVCFNAMLAALTAAVPDRVPVAQRGAVSGWVGMPQVLGVVLGVVLVTVVVTGRPGGLHRGRDRGGAADRCRSCCPRRTTRWPGRTARRCGRRAALLGSARASTPTSRWAFGTRFLVQLGNALGTLYLLYFLTDAVRLRPTPSDGLLILILIYTGRR